jgi:hypothetical protein
MAGFVLRVLIVALGLWLASELVPGIDVDGPGRSVSVKSRDELRQANGGYSSGTSFVRSQIAIPSFCRCSGAHPIIDLPTY